MPLNHSRGRGIKIREGDNNTNTSTSTAGHIKLPWTRDAGHTVNQHGGSAHPTSHPASAVTTATMTMMRDQPPLYETSRSDSEVRTSRAPNECENMVDESGSSYAREPPPGHSSLNEPNGALVNAFRNLLANENRDDALAQIFASLITNQQRPAQAQQLVAQAIPTYHVIPDLSKNIEVFTGDDDSARARSWIENLEAMQRLHQWPEEYLFESARTHLQYAAKDWYQGRMRQLTSWSSFREAFREEFIVRDDMSTKWTRMKSRVQDKSESINRYFHSKTKLCSDLQLTYREIKAEVLVGLWSRELASVVMPTTQYTTTELLHDLLYYDKIISQRTERIRTSRDANNVIARRAVDKSRVNDFKRPEGASRVNKEPQRTAESKNSSDIPRQCYNCKRTGHAARDCPEPAREITCYKCGEKGHISRKCTGENKLTVRTIGQMQDISATKYMKVAEVNGRKINAFIDTGSSECTIKATRVIAEQFTVTPHVTELRGFGPPESVVTSPGIVKANISVDDVEVSGVEMRVVPDSAQPFDTIIGRTFTDKTYVEYHKVGDTLTFKRNRDLPDQLEPMPSYPSTTQDTILPPRMISFIDVADRYETYSVPILNLGSHENFMKKGHNRHIRGEMSRLLPNTKPSSDPPVITLRDINVGPEQPEDIVHELCKVINEYRDCVSTSLRDLGCATNIEMDIQLREASVPVCSKPYRTTEKERGEIKGILNEWREAGVITETQSPFASPVLLVKKKTGESRLCVDFRKLNQQTKRIHFPLPNVDDHLALIRDSTLFIVLDLAHGYLQIPLSKTAREKTAIITSEETAEFTRMIFGLMNGPAYFSKAMHQALGPLRDSVVLFYLDDILIPGTSWEDLKPKLKSVFEALRKTGLTIKLAKCKFLYQTVAYLGHEISANGIAPGLNKVGAIKDFPSPQNVHDVRRYLGLTSYFRKFIPRFAQIAEPLHHLLKANVEFEWKEPQRIAFELLKSKLIEGPVLQLFNPHAETELHTDASSSGLAAMLMQKDEAGKLRLIYAISRRTSIPESNYHSSKLELLAIVWAVSRLRTMLANIPFTIVTVCQALCYMSTQKTLNPQMVRWNDLLSEYDYKIVHRPGVRLAHVDALSRAPVENHDSLENLSVMSINNEKDTVRMYQYIDSEILNKKKILEKPKNQRTKHEQSAVTDFSLIEGIVYKIRNDRLLYVVPRAMRKSLVVQFHDLKSHQGIDRTVSRIMEHYYFPRMKSYVKRHIRACLQCIASKAVPGRQAGELHPITPGHRPFAVIHIDHLGPFVTSSRGNKYVFAIIDNLTKFVIIRAVKDTKTASVVRILDEVVQEYGAPTRIVSDRGTSFTSSVFEAFCKKHGIRHTLNSPRHPQANGQVERLNATLIPAIQNNLVQNDGRDWDKNIRKIRNDLNEMKNASTGKSPFELVYGYVPRRDEGEVRKLTCDNESTYSNPSKLQQEAKRKIAIEQAKMKIRYDANRIRNVEFDVGCLVYMKTAPIATGESTKLQLRYRGPLVIVRKLSSDTYLVSDLSDNVPGRRYATTAHASQLKLWEAERIESDDDSNNDESGPDTSSEDEARIQQRDNVLKLRNADVTACNDMTVSANEISEIECLKNNCQNANVSMNAIEESELRRSTRIKKAPQKLKDYELNS